MKKILPLLLAAVFLTAAAGLAGHSSLARYRSGGAGSDSARTAGFLVEAGTPELKSGDAVLDLNDPDDCVVYEIEIVNRSETDVDYEAVVTGLREWVQAEVSNGRGSLTANGGSVRITVTLRAGTGGLHGAGDLTELALSVSAVQKKEGT